MMINNKEKAIILIGILMNSIEHDDSLNDIWWCLEMIKGILKDSEGLEVASGTFVPEKDLKSVVRS